MSYFASCANNSVDVGFLEGLPTSNLYNDKIKSDSGTQRLADSGANANIIKNIPLTSINTIQAIVLYNKKNNIDRAVGMIMELYDTRYDPNLTEKLATTNLISQGGLLIDLIFNV
jgi:hypothetical protein